MKPLLSIIPLLLLLSPATAYDAPTVANAKNAPSYSVTFADSDAVTGTITFSPTIFGSVQVEVDMTGFPAVGGPFKYHVHQAAVAPGLPKDCLSTLAHLDPYDRTEFPACDSSKPASCQLGDLSGKYGTLDASDLINASNIYNFNNFYVDEYLRLGPGADGIQGRSVLFHNANGNRIACADLVELPPAQSSAVASSSALPSLTQNYSIPAALSIGHPPLVTNATMLLPGSAASTSSTSVRGAMTTSLNAANRTAVTTSRSEATTTVMSTGLGEVTTTAVETVSSEVSTATTASSTDPSTSPANSHGHRLASAITGHLVSVLLGAATILAFCL